MSEIREYQNRFTKIKLKDFQIKFLNDDSKILVGDISRNGGKTFLLANKVLKDRPNNVLFVGLNKNQFNMLFVDKIKNILNCSDINEDIEYMNIKKENIFIKWNNNQTTNIYNYYSLNIELMNQQLYDMILFNDVLPQFNLKSKKYVSIVSINKNDFELNDIKNSTNYFIGINHLIKEGIFTNEYINKIKDDEKFNSEIDILNEYNYEFNKQKIINQQIKELYEEFSSIDKTEKTTIRREKVLLQIKILEDMKEKYCNNKN